MYELRLLIECEERYRATKSPPSPYPSTTLPADHLSSPSSSAAPATIAMPVMSAWVRRQLHLLVTVLYNNPPLLLDLLKNSCDIVIPLDRLGIYPTGPGFVGACGLASSVLSILTMVHPWLKLKPWTQIHVGRFHLRSYKEGWDQTLTGLIQWSFCEDSSCRYTVITFWNRGRASKSFKYRQNKWWVASMRTLETLTRVTVLKCSDAAQSPLLSSFPYTHIKLTLFHHDPLILHIPVLQRYLPILWNFSHLAAHTILSRKNAESRNSPDASKSLVGQKNKSKQKKRSSLTQKDLVQ